MKKWLLYLFTYIFFGAHNAPASILEQFDCFGLLKKTKTGSASLKDDQLSIQKKTESINPYQNISPIGIDGDYESRRYVAQPGTPKKENNDELVISLNDFTDYDKNLCQNEKIYFDKSKNLFFEYGTEEYEFKDMPNEMTTLDSCKLFDSIVNLYDVEGTTRISNNWYKDYYPNEFDSESQALVENHLNNKNYNEKPYSNVGSLMIYDYNPNKCKPHIVYYGSGIAISEQYILTAGHNLLTKTIKGKSPRIADSITFYPGLHLIGSDIPKGARSFDVEKVALPQKFVDLYTSDDSEINKQAKSYDLALLKISSSSSLGKKFPQFLPPNEQCHKTHSFIGVGYPGQFLGCAMLSKKLTFNKLYEDRYRLLFDGTGLYKGMSGGAIFRRFNNRDHLVGIYTHGSNNQGSATYLSSKIIEEIKSLREELDKFK